MFTGRLSAPARVSTGRWGRDLGRGAAGVGRAEGSPDRLICGYRCIGRASRPATEIKLQP
jgi:hypothetical protein